MSYFNALATADYIDSTSRLFRASHLRTVALFRRWTKFYETYYAMLQTYGTIGWRFSEWQQTYFEADWGTLKTAGIFVEPTFETSFPKEVLPPTFNTGFFSESLVEDWIDGGGNFENFYNDFRAYLDTLGANIDEQFYYAGFMLWWMNGCYQVQLTYEQALLFGLDHTDD